MTDTLRAYAGGLRNIARYSWYETRRAYRDVGPYTAAHVALAVPAHLLRLWWRDRVRGGEDDRGQVSGGPWVAGSVVIGLIVLAIVVEQMLSRVAAVDGPVTFCGLCHVDWRLAVTPLVIGGLLVIAGWALGGPKWPPEGDGG